MIKCKIKNEEGNKNFYDNEFEVEIVEGLNKVYLTNIKEYHNLYIANMFYHIKDNLYLEDENQNKYSLVKIKHWNEKGKLCIECQCFYKGKTFISDVTNISKVSVFFGDNFIDECDSKIKEVMNSNIVFSSNNIKVSIENTKLTMEGHALPVINENSLFRNIYELLWLIYGFFPKIERIEYLLDTNDILTEYISTLYLYNSSTDHFLKLNTIVDIEKIISFSYLIENWKRVKNKTGVNAFLGLLLAQSKYNPHIDIQLCNLLQSIDGLTENILADIPQKTKKIQMVEFMRACLDTYHESKNQEEKNTEKDIRQNLKGALRDLKKYSFKERLDLLIQGCKYQHIFLTEMEMTYYFKKEKNQCKIFLKYNHLLKKCVNHRNYLSHMREENDVFSAVEIKMYYWKFLLLYRLVLLEQLELSEAIIDENVEKYIEHTLNWYKNRKMECENCPYYSNNKCRILSNLEEENK